MEDIQLIEHQRHSRELGYKPDAIREGVDVVDETDSCDKSYGYQKPDVLEAKEGCPDPKPQDENYSATSKHYTAVRGTLVRFIDNVKPIRNLEVNYFQAKENHENDSKRYILIHF